MLRKRIISLTICFVMMCLAAVCVNKSLFGHSFQEGQEETTAIADTVSFLSDRSAVIHTALLSDAAGYAGPVPLDIYITEGRIDSISPLPNTETPGFFERASEILAQWKGLTPDEGIALQVDAVSGATYSSNAIIDNVHAGLAYYRHSAAAASGKMPLKLWIAFAVTLAACIIPLFVRNRIYNNIQLLANVVVLGFWCGQFIDYSLMLKYLSSGIAIPTGLAAIAMLTAAFIYPLFGKPQHYCNHICPLGSAQILMAQVFRYKIKLNASTLKTLNWFRKILWAVLMILLWADTLTGWMDLELFQGFLVESAPIGIIIAAVLFVILSAIVARPYCRFVCPTGSLIKQAENIG